MSDQRYDLIVIGASMVGVAAATTCAAQGWDIAKPGHRACADHERPSRGRTACVVPARMNTSR